MARHSLTCQPPRLLALALTTCVVVLLTLATIAHHVSHWSPRQQTQQLLQLQPKALTSPDSGGAGTAVDGMGGRVYTGEQRSSAQVQSTYKVNIQLRGVCWCALGELRAWSCLVHMHVFLPHTAASCVTVCWNQRLWKYAHHCLHAQQPARCHHHTAITRHECIQRASRLHNDAPSAISRCDWRPLGCAGGVLNSHPWQPVRWWWRQLL
jgi:hypothetical protein